ncbi:sulfatase-like hydrolase/transferase [Neorhodopirellula lusitana]|uniref:sulfatase-like hydrolase/transferase n=1 Tax=Neorhodopirellula lusitana TaxID=445327 RepID=UPI00384EF68E
MGKLLSAKAVNFIQDSSQKEKPLFLYYCSPMVHLPHCPTDEFDGRRIKGSTPTDHLDMTADLDMQVKRIVDALKASGQFENTLIVFSSDNGGLGDKKATQAIGYRPGVEWNGTKNSPLEGGHRVPTFAVWPGHIQPGVTDELAVNQDMVATFAALVGTEIPKGQAQDSNNLLPLLTGKSDFRKREYLINQAGSKQELMLRTMPWKIIIQSTFKRTKYEPLALYNLQDDPGEKNNLIKNPEFKGTVDRMFKEYMDIINSGRPTVPGR